MISSLIHLTKQLQNSPLEYRLLYKQKFFIQSSVAIILTASNSFQSYVNASFNENQSYIERIESQRIQFLNYLQRESEYINQHRINHNPQHDLEIDIVLIKRNDHPNDPHPGQIAYPGGKVNSNENDYACSIRETKEEIGIDLDKCAFSLGRLPQNIFAYFMKDDRQMMIAANVFFIPRKLRIEEIKIDEREVRDIMFLPMNNFFKQPILIGNFQSSKEPLQIFSKNGKLQLIIKYFLRDFQSIQVNYKNLKLKQTPYYLYNGEKFYGLSWLLFLSLLRKMDQENQKVQEIVRNTSASYQFNFKGQSNFKQQLFKRMYDYKRLNQFFL